MDSSCFSLLPLEIEGMIINYETELNARLVCKRWHAEYDLKSFFKFKSRELISNFESKDFISKSFCERTVKLFEKKHPITGFVIKQIFRHLDNFTHIEMIQIIRNLFDNCNSVYNSKPDLRDEIVQKFYDHTACPKALDLRLRKILFHKLPPIEHQSCKGFIVPFALANFPKTEVPKELMKLAVTRHSGQMEVNELVIFEDFGNLAQGATSLWFGIVKSIDGANCRISISGRFSELISRRTIAKIPDNAETRLYIPSFFLSSKTI